MREHLTSQKVGLENHIAGILKPFGLVVVRDNIAPDVVRKRVAEDHGVKIKAMANADPICRRLMMLTASP